MRICIVTHLYPIDAADYKGVHVHQMASALAARGHEVHVVTPRRVGAAKREVRDGVRIERYWYWGWWRGWQLGQLAGYSPLTLASLFLIGIWKAIGRARRCDLIHAYWVVPGGFIAAVAGAVCGRPVVATAAGTDLNMVAGRRLVRAFVRMALKGSDRLIAAGSDMKRLAVELGMNESAVVVLPSCFIEIMAPGKKEKADAGGCQFLYVGNLEKPKRVDTILRGFARARRGDARLLIVGKGTLREELEKLAKELGIFDSVRFSGALPHEQIGPMMTEADVFVHCSDHEGLPVAIVEAIQAGLPVIAARVGGVPDVVRDGENGFVLEPDDDAGYGEKMEILMVNETLREHMAERARAFAQEKLNGTTVMDRIEGFYRELGK
ncbi:glycosyltransferase [bacterium]|nr:glycosyltransferase [bacterium]